MRIGFPLAALAYAGTDAARCEAAAEPYRPRVALPPALPEHRLLMMRAVDALADELLTMLRAVYLVRKIMLRLASLWPWTNVHGTAKSPQAKFTCKLTALCVR